MKKILIILCFVYLIFGCTDTPGFSEYYTTEYVDVYDTFGEYWGHYLHYFTSTIEGLEQVFRQNGYTADPPLRKEIIVVDTTTTLSANVTYEMGQQNAVFAGTFYIKNNKGSFPVSSGETGDLFFLLHVKINNKFYSGAYKKEGSVLRGNYYPDWVNPIK